MDTNTSKSKLTKQLSDEENQNNYNYSSAPIENTPFTMWKDDKKGFIITLGNSAITGWKQTEKEALKELPKTNWKTMMSIISAISANVYDFKTEQRIQDAIKMGGQ